jgi:ABC-type antimicrobial peptide transport system ATPase subunit
MLHVFFRCLLFASSILFLNATFLFPLLDSLQSSSSFVVRTDSGKSTFTESSLSELFTKRITQKTSVAISFKNLVFEPSPIITTDMLLNALNNIATSVTQKLLNITTEIQLTLQSQLSKEIKFVFLFQYLMINHLPQIPFNAS